MGVRVTRQGDSGYEEKFDLHRDSRSIPYYWRTGSYKMSDVEEGTDALALAEGFVSVTPVSFDLTSHEMLAELKHWDLSERRQECQRLGRRPLPGGGNSGRPVPGAPRAPGC